MRIAIAAALVAAGSCGAASAQMSSTTCSVTAGKYVNCFTMAPPPMFQPIAPAPTYVQPAPDYSGFGNLFVALRERSERKRAEKEAAKEATINEAARAGVVARIQAGDCHGALDYAVMHGTLSYASEVADYCQHAAPITPAQ